MTLSSTDFELLLQANRILSSTLDVNDVLLCVMEYAMKVVRAEASSLLLLDDRTQELYFDVALGRARDSVKEIRLKVGEGIAGWVAKERRALIVNDVSKDARFTGKVDKSTSFQTKSILAVPLIVRDKLIGVVEAINKSNGGEFSAQDQQIFEAFASQSAIAIENARLFSTVNREKQKLTTVFAEISDGLFLLAPDGGVSMMNAAAERFIGKKQDVVVGQKFGPTLFPGFEFTPSLEQIESIVLPLTPLELVRRERVDFYLSGALLRLPAPPDGVSEGFLVILRDTTEMKKGEKIKRNFLSLISHKLKTPLTVIMGYAPMLEAGPAAKAIRDQSENLNGLIDKLLRYSIVESDTLKKEVGLQSLAPIIKEAADAVPGLSRDNVTFSIDSSVAAAPSVHIDAILTFDVFKNLLENAVKFNDKSQKNVRVFAGVEDRFVVVKVKDNGAGIPAEERVKVFEKFHQIENSFTGQVPGAGLGLALCKKVIEEMGGKILLASELGKGTTVSVSFPRA